MTCRAFAAVVGASILLALSTSTANAANDDARLGWFEPIARAAWPGSPCAGVEMIHLHADAFLTAGSTVLGYTIIGYSNPATCEVWMASGLDPVLFCTVLTHEFGHLDGKQHTNIPGDVMNGNGDIYWQPCNDAVARAGVAAVETPPKPLHHRWFNWGPRREVRYERHHYRARRKHG